MLNYFGKSYFTREKNANYTLYRVHKSGGSVTGFVFSLFAMLVTLLIYLDETSTGGFIALLLFGIFLLINILDAKSRKVPTTIKVTEKAISFNGKSYQTEDVAGLSWRSGRSEDDEMVTYAPRTILQQTAQYSKAKHEGRNKSLYLKLKADSRPIVAVKGGLTSEAADDLMSSILDDLRPNE